MTGLDDQMKRAPLKCISEKRAREMREYSKLRKTFLAERPYCQIFEPGCTRKATEVHHTNGRNGKRLLDMSECLPSCRNCHRYLHDHPAYARAAGFLK